MCLFVIKVTYIRLFCLISSQNKPIGLVLVLPSYCQLGISCSSSTKRTLPCQKKSHWRHWLRSNSLVKPKVSLLSNSFKRYSSSADVSITAYGGDLVLSKMIGIRPNYLLLVGHYNFEVLWMHAIWIEFQKPVFLLIIAANVKKSVSVYVSLLVTSLSSPGFRLLHSCLHWVP